MWQVFLTMALYARAVRRSELARISIAFLILWAGAVAAGICGAGAITHHPRAPAVAVWAFAASAALAGWAWQARDGLRRRLELKDAQAVIQAVIDHDIAILQARTEGDTP